MARSEIPVVEVIRDGVGAGASVLSDSVNGHYFVGNAGKTWIEVESSDAGTQTILVQPSPFLATDGLNVDPFPLEIPPGTVTKAGPWRMKTFNQDRTDGSVFLDPSVSGTLRLYAFSMEPAT